MHAGIVSDLAIVLTVAGVTALVFRKLRQSSVLGYLFAGLIVGPYLPVPLFADVERMHELAELGVILVMFGVGLEFRLAKLAAVLPRAGLTVAVEVGLLFAAGYGLGMTFGWTPVGALFLGSCMAISSTMTVSKVLDPVRTEPALRELVMSVLVLQDVVAIALIAAMTAVAAGGGLSLAELGWTLAKLAGVLAGMLLGGLLIVPRLLRWTASLESPEVLVVVNGGLAFGFAALAAELGYSVALGAFVAGMLVSESGRGQAVEHLFVPTKDIFAAIFFVSIGMTVDPADAFVSGREAVAVTVVVIAAQLVGVGVGGILSGNGPRRSLSAGLALGQVGEFAFILATIGSQAGVVPSSLGPIMVTAAVLSTFTTPHIFARAPAVVGAFDRLTPRRLRSLITMYTCWLEGALAEPSAPGTKAARSVLLDAAGIALTAGLALWLAPLSSSWLAEAGLAAPSSLERWVAPLLIVVLAAPFAWSLLRNTATLARGLVGEGLEHSVAESATRRVVRAAVLIALLGPGGVVLAWTGAVIPAAVLAGLSVAVLFGVWRTAGQVELEIESGAERILAHLTGDTPQAVNTPLLQGLDHAVRIELQPDSRAAGRTLAEIDLRVQTGATVVGVHNPERADVAIPTGHERLEPGDVLVVVGTPESQQAARALLEPPG